MAETAVDDLLALDRDVARAATELARWRVSLASEPDTYAEEHPIDPVRRVSTKSTWEALGGGSPRSADAPLREGLRRWVYVLLQARIAHDDDVAVARARKRPQAILEREQPRLVSWSDAWRGAVASKTVAETAMWLAAAGAAGEDVSAAIARRAQRRVEVARRLGLDRPWAPIVRVAPDTLRATAATFLDSTEEMSRAVWKERVRGSGTESAPPARIHASMARDAGEGWPARLTPRWLHDVFAASSGGLIVDLAVVPARLGAASFARVLCAFGHAVRLALAPATVPFAIAREPAFVAAHRLGYVFASLAADPEFQTRVLGISRRTAVAQARLLAWTAFQEARLQASRIVLGAESAPPTRQLFEEVGSRLFGAPLDRRLQGAWPEVRDDEPARWIALLESVRLRSDLRDRFDADWFRNPRAWTDLREQGAAPAVGPAEGPSVLQVRVDELSRAFEGALS
jgi:hypothetical protein